MLIKKLNATKKPAAQAALVLAAKAELRQRIAKCNNPVALNTLSKNIARTSKQHAAAASLIMEADYATARAKKILSRVETIAMKVFDDGAKYFRKNQIRTSPRIPQMIRKHRTWTNVHAQLVRNGAGGERFEELCGAGKADHTSEWFVVNHAPFLIDSALLAQVTALLNEQEAKSAALREAA